MWGNISARQCTLGATGDQPAPGRPGANFRRGGQRIRIPATGGEGVGGHTVSGVARPWGGGRRARMGAGGGTNTERTGGPPTPLGGLQKPRGNRPPRVPRGPAGGGGGGTHRGSVEQKTVRSKLPPKQGQRRNRGRAYGHTRGPPRGARYNLGGGGPGGPRATGVGLPGGPPPEKDGPPGGGEHISRGGGRIGNTTGGESPTLSGSRCSNRGIGAATPPRQRGKKKKKRKVGAEGGPTALVGGPGPRGGAPGGTGGQWVKISRL